MNDYTIGLALYDFLPVIFTGVALFFITRLVETVAPDQKLMAAVGAGLVVTAGLLKAIWKLEMAVAGQDVVWMAEALFPLMAPGFTLLAAAVWIAMRRLHGKSSPKNVWLAPLAAIVLVYGIAALRFWLQGVERGWFMPIMSLASLTNLWLTALLMIEAGRRGKWGVSLLFIVNVGMIFVLQAIAPIQPKPIALHWFEQTLTTFGAAAFALASYLLFKLVRGTVGVRQLAMGD
ncbi:MAG: hypothetical protein IPM39_29150 [Chloroflexi bacterium]|nr:hypothetical protein [Chloroflexota bacterium]